MMAARIQIGVMPAATRDRLSFEDIMDQHLELFADLAAPFPHRRSPDSPAGSSARFTTSRPGPYESPRRRARPGQLVGRDVPLENWVICRLTIRLPDGTTLTKSDAGGYAGMADSGDDDKSGFSDAFKRAAVKFGVGRYLYRDGVPASFKTACATPRWPPTRRRRAHTPAHAPPRKLNRLPRGARLAGDGPRYTAKWQGTLCLDQETG